MTTCDFTKNDTPKFIFCSKRHPNSGTSHRIYGSYPPPRTNESILNELGKKLTLKSKIRKQQANFFGHAMRRQGLENLITTARVLGKRSRGRPREKILDGVRKWAGEERTVDLITKTQDRELWRNMVSNAFRQGT